MIREVGLLDKIRVIKSSPLMVRFSLITINKTVNCVVVNPDLTIVIMMLMDGKYNVAVEGHYNQRKQLIVTNFTVRNPDSVAKDLGL
ncbi:hypothetical protein FQS87_08220 [Enterococcus avium]|uniref:hypothetical protein n=1 Tax=Enterococcus TaxID=1350 RepID=UPI001A971ED7|nr:hypothetical protein [Enterococcus avium]MBO1139880.1 hypothetical protein [Enterococcus avium]